jgi:hypothetical protein
MEYLWIAVWDSSREVRLVIAASEESVRIIIEDQLGPKYDPNYSVELAAEQMLRGVLSTVWKDQQIFTIN